MGITEVGLGNRRWPNAALLMLSLWDYGEPAGLCNPKRNTMLDNQSIESTKSGVQEQTPCLCLHCYSGVVDKFAETVLGSKVHNDKHRLSLSLPYGLRSLAGSACALLGLWRRRNVEHTGGPQRPQTPTVLALGMLVFFPDWRGERRPA